ncbi:MAG: sensor histidine kinase [Rhizobiales bacterium]|nr:sensor histidine kinase [Hyphomicrobiales bacterium]
MVADLDQNDDQSRAGRRPANRRGKRRDQAAGGGWRHLFSGVSRYLPFRIGSASFSGSLFGGALGRSLWQKPPRAAGHQNLTPSNLIPTALVQSDPDQADLTQGDEDESNEPRRSIVETFSLVRATIFSSLLRRIVILNLIALLVLVVGIQFSNKFRKGLIVARVESLLTQGKIIAGAISASATVERDAITIDPEKLLSLEVGGPDGTVLPDVQSLDFPIDPQKVAPVLRQLIAPDKLRARIYDRHGELILDSRFLYSGGSIQRFDLPPIDPPPVSWWERLWNNFQLWTQKSNFPTYQEHRSRNGRAYPEVTQALNGTETSVVRVREKGEIIVSVAVPVQRFRAVLGALLLSTEGSDIDETVRAERLAIYRVFLVAAIVTVILSIVLWVMIASPLRRLSDAADSVRTAGGRANRAKIPHFGERSDEIGHLSKSLRDMTDALYARIDAIGNFAADVSHELKNPLTSLRSAVETLPLARTDENRKKLLGIIHHDVMRLDRLITDISDASRLDAELARESAEPVNLKTLLMSLTTLNNEVHGDQVMIQFDLPKADKTPLFVNGHEGRLGQVVNNLLDNARSFVPTPGGRIRIAVERKRHAVEIRIEDNGPGIDPAAFERIFNRFYTDRPGGGDTFGRNSGLGLSISKQIVEAHHGTIHAENIMVRREDGVLHRAGARFIVRLPID